jgi:hypothetical protein
MRLRKEGSVFASLIRGSIDALVNASGRRAREKHLAPYSENMTQR